MELLKDQAAIIMGDSPVMTLDTTQRVTVPRSPTT